MYYFCWECGPTRRKQNTKTLKIDNTGYYYSLLCFHPGCNYNEAHYVRPKQMEELLGEKPLLEKLITFQLPINEEHDRPPLGDDEVDYDYRDINGNLLFFIRRFPGKEFLPVSMSEDGEWQCKRPKIKALYGAEYLAKYPNSNILIVEGEKAADYARSVLKGCDVIILTWPGGANGVTQGDWDLIENRKVIIWPDNDQPGLQAGLEIYSLLMNKNEVYALDPLKYGLEEKTDIYDIGNREHIIDMLGDVLDDKT